MVELTAALLVRACNPAPAKRSREEPRAGFSFIREFERGVGVTPRLLLTRREAAEALRMSLSHFQRHVQPHLRCVYSGQLRLYRPQDLQLWLEKTACDPARR